MSCFMSSFSMFLNFECYNMLQCYSLIYKLGLNIKDRLSLNSQMIVFPKFTCR